MLVHKTHLCLTADTKQPGNSDSRHATGFDEVQSLHGNCQKDAGTAGAPCGLDAAQLNSDKQVD